MFQEILFWKKTVVNCIRILDLYLIIGSQQGLNPSCLNIFDFLSGYLGRNNEYLRGVCPRRTKCENKQIQNPQRNAGIHRGDGRKSGWWGRSSTSVTSLLNLHYNELVKKMSQTIWHRFSALFSMLFQMMRSVLLSVFCHKNNYVRDFDWLLKIQI